MSKYDVGFRRDANGEWQIIDDDNEMNENEIIEARLALREALGLPSTVDMNVVRGEVGYLYHSANEFDMPLDFYGDDVSTETFGG